MVKGRIFIISAPSGTGKSTVVAELRRRFPQIEFSVSCTTRPRRGAERDGIDYHFIDRARFEGMVQTGKFAEWAEVHGEFYGTPLAPLEEAQARGLDLLLDIDVQGGMAIKHAFPDAIAIFLVPPSMEELERRLANRGTDSPEQVSLRLANARREMGFRDRYDSVVVNDDVARCVQELSGMMAGGRVNRCRVGTN